MVPGSFPSPIFDIANHGRIQRYSVLSIRAGDGDLEKDRKVASLTVSPTDGVIRVLQPFHCCGPRHKNFGRHLR